MYSDSIIINNNDKTLEMKFISDEFVWLLNTDEIIIDYNIGMFYEELNAVMNNDYIFDGNIPCYKDKNKLVWLSDQYCDVSDEESLSRVNRLIIERKGSSFLIKIYNPFFEENNIKRSYYVISFSPLFNGYYSRNIESGLSLQDDFCLMYQNILECKKHVFC